MKVREVIRILEHEGWRQVRQGGSHRQFQHPNTSRYRHRGRRTKR
ncbi:MAG: type II toxin-antitoxin system HicA family toxin [Acidimicrobiales bacterium]